jgi:predicted permease
MWNDLRFAARWLRRSPGFALVAVASLALGIGFNTALFSFVDAVMFRPLPVREPDRLVDVYTNSSDGDRYASNSYPDYLDLKASSTVFDDLIGYSPAFAMLSGGDRSRLALGEVVTGNYFRVLGLRASLGRTLLPEDDKPGAPPVVMVSQAFWKREMGGDAAAIGRPLRIRGEDYAVVGVAPSGFGGLTPVIAAELWVPMSRVTEVEPVGMQDSVPSPTGTTRLDRRGQRWMWIKGRMRSGATLEQAAAETDLLMRRLVAEHPQTNKDRFTSIKASNSVRLNPAVDAYLLPAATGLMVVVGLVLLIACANVASMLLARSSARQKEMAIRLALGASRGRLARQLLTESLLLALSGAAAGATLAWLLMRTVSRLDLPIPIPLSVDLRVDLRVLGFTLVLGVLAGVLAGLAPAVRASKPAVANDLRGEQQLARVGRMRWTLRDGLVACQIAVTLVLLVGAFLLGRSLIASQQAEVGFRTQGLSVVSTDPEMLRYDEQETRAFWREALARVRALPGVQAAAIAERAPFSLNFNVSSIYIPDRQGPSDKPIPIKSARVSGDYFQTLGIPLLQGRVFSETDTPEAPGVVVVNETMARRYWPGQLALGRRLRLRGPDGPSFEIVGVVADHRVQTVGEAATPYVHFAYSQRPGGYQTLVARTAGDAGALLAGIRRELLALEPRTFFLENQTMEMQVQATLLPAKAAAWVVGVVAAVGMLLAAIGLYGVIAYAVGRRVREIGIRMALGATRGHVLGSVMSRGLTVAVAGLAAGTLLAAAAAQAISGVLYRVGPADPFAWGLALTLLLAVSALANLLPARRAARIDPSVALRTE